MKKALIESLVTFSRTHLLIVAGFLALSIAYMSPVLDGKVLSQHDMTQFDGIRQELTKHYEETGEFSQWTNSQFSGMPGFHVGPSGKSPNIFGKIAIPLRLFITFRNPIAILFVYLICFYVLMLALRINPWVSALGAIAFAFSSYNLIILEPGHINKAYALAYMAPVIAGILVTYRGKYLEGGFLFLLGLGLELFSNHLQITYYLLIMALTIVIAKGIYAVMEKQVKKFMIASGVLVVAAIFALLPNLSTIWVNYEITKESIRGKPERTANMENQTSGLDKDYALAWSYGKDETFSLMIPYMTGGRTGALGGNEKAMEKVSPQFRETVASQNQYWGAKASTAGDNYSGAIVVFFFIMGIILIKGPMRWWIIVSSLLSVTLAWGSNFPGLSHFFLDHVPLYNKFRTVEMTLVIICFNIPLLAFLILDRILKEPVLITEKRKQVLTAFGITGGLSLLFFLLPGIFSFFSEREQQMFNQQLAGANPQYASQFRQFMDELEAARIYIFRHDAMRSFLLISAAFLLTWFYAIKKVKLAWFLGGLALLITVEMWLVDRRYLSKDNFITKSQETTKVSRSQADEFILGDPDIHFRVVNLTKSPWQDGTNSYYHKSIGGYSALKLRRYQDLIEGYLSPGLQRIIGVLNAQPTITQVDSVMARQQVLNMINTKYFILNPQSQPLQNRFALGHGWLVGDYHLVENADQEYGALGTTDLTRTAVVDRKFEGLLTGDLKPGDAPGSVELTSYQANHMVYKISAEKRSLAVFSDVYYGEHWQATVDGEPVEHLRANYILRALPVDAGEHTVEFRFVFKPYETGIRISMAGSILVLLLILGGLAYKMKEVIRPVPGKDGE